MITILKIIFPVYMIPFFGIAIRRSYVTWKRTGANPYAPGNGDTVHDSVGKPFRVTLTGTTLIVLAFSFFESVYLLSTPVSWLSSSWFIAFGLVLLTVALIVIDHFLRGLDHVLHG